MADLCTPARSANEQSMGGLTTPRPRTMFQCRTESSRSQRGNSTASPLSLRTGGELAAAVVGDVHVNAYGVPPKTFLLSNGNAGNLGFESDEEFKTEHDSVKLAIQFKKKSPNSCPRIGTMGDQSSAQDSNSNTSTLVCLPDHRLPSSFATRSRQSSSASSIQSFRTTPENTSEIELMSSIEAEKKCHGDTALKLQDVCFELDSTKKSLQFSLKYSSQLEETNITLSNEVDSLKKKLKAAEAEYDADKDMLLNRIVTLRDSLENATISFGEKQEAAAEKIATPKFQLQEIIEARDLATAESSEVAEDSMFLQGSIDDLRMQLREAEDANTRTSTRKRRLEELNERLAAKIEAVQNQPEQTAGARDSAQQKVSSLQDSLLVTYSTDLEKLLGQLRTMVTASDPSLSTSERNHLQDHIKYLREARGIEVQLVAHLFQKCKDLTEQVTKLQTENSEAIESRNATKIQMSEIMKEKYTAVKDNAVLAARLTEVINFQDFAQKQILRFQQDKVANQLSCQAPTKASDIETTFPNNQVIHDNSKEESMNDNAALLSEIDSLKNLLEEEKLAHKSYQTKLTCSEASLRNVKKLLEQENSAHKISTEKPEKLLQRDTVVQSSITAKVIDLQASLEKEQSAHLVCKINLTRAADELQLSVAANETSLGKISQLKSRIELHKPLFQVGMLARQLWWELARDGRYPGGEWYTYRNRGVKNSALVDSAEAKMKQPDRAADASLFLLGALTHRQDHNMFMSIYDHPVPSGIREATNPVLLVKVTNMKAELRERRRLSAYAYEVNFANSEIFYNLESECKMAFNRMMGESGLSMSAVCPERRDVEDAFDRNPVMRANLRIMEQIFNKEMKKYRNVTKNQ